MHARTLDGIQRHVGVRAHHPPHVGHLVGPVLLGQGQPVVLVWVIPRERGGRLLRDPFQAILGHSRDAHACHLMTPSVVLIHLQESGSLMELQ